MSDDAPIPGRSLIHEAAKRGYTDQIQEQYEEDNSRLNARDHLGNLPIHWASNGGHLESVKYLISVGSEINVQNLNGDTPLHCAAWKGGLAVCAALMEGDKAAPSIEVRNKEGKKPIELAKDPQAWRYLSPKVEIESDEDYGQEDEDSD
eukprot:TRINITY_DN467_c0_g1_i1.p1 TRINITY_DN467_c0_g1~~TRINITY_DN467_c0_g1_i1.p1  ORF type:complete len:159 (-),score=39.06 TRINITY_DN467_c0_g1_i1:205-651(-)